MAMNAEPSTSEVEVPHVDNHLYQIDQDAFDAAGESFDFMVWRRLCWTGDCRICKGSEGNKPPVPVKLRSINTLFNSIRRCARREDYILANMSILEVVFRILLRGGNEPMRLLDIAEQIEQEWVAVLAMKSVSPLTIQRLLESPNQYRIRRAPDQS